MLKVLPRHVSRSSERKAQDFQHRRVARTLGVMGRNAQEKRALGEGREGSEGQEGERQEARGKGVKITRRGKRAREVDITLPLFCLPGG